MKKQETKFKKQNVFIVVNIVIIFLITCFYAYRLIHYYRIEHPKLDKKWELSEIITLKKNITSVGNGLYKEDNEYVFKGNEVDNYLEYSGYMFRILSVNSMGNIKAITEEALTNLAWGVDSNYETSYINSWLNGSEKNAGIFYKSLNNPEQFLVDNTFCIDTLDEKSTKCNKTTISKVGLLSLIEYKNAKGNKSFLNTNNYWWLGNSSKDGIWYVYNNGKLDDEYMLGKDYYSYGIRPVISLNGKISVVSGDGSKNTPYKIEQESTNVLKEKNVGKYIKYSDLTWRIIEKNDQYVRVALDGVIKENNEDFLRIYSNNYNVYSATADIGYYLNSTFYNTLDKTYMKTGYVYNNRYDSTVDFDYLNIFSSSIKANVGMMQAGDLFMNDYKDYFLVSRTSTYVGTVYKVVDDNTLYADFPTSKAKIRPVIFLDLESPIKSGNGSKTDPYIIG